MIELASQVIEVAKAVHKKAESIKSLRTECDSMKRVVLTIEPLVRKISPTLTPDPANTKALKNILHCLREGEKILDKIRQKPIRAKIWSDSRVGDLQRITREIQGASSFLSNAQNAQMQEEIKKIQNAQILRGSLDVRTPQISVKVPREVPRDPGVTKLTGETHEAIRVFVHNKADAYCGSKGSGGHTPADKAEAAKHKARSIGLPLISLVDGYLQWEYFQRHGDFNLASLEDAAKTTINAGQVACAIEMATHKAKEKRDKSNAKMHRDRFQAAENRWRENAF